MKKEVQMCAIITVRFKKPTNIDIGGFAIENEKGVIPFDFDAESRRVMPLSDSVYQIEYTSGHGPFFHDYDVSDSCDEEYAKLGLSRQDITARFLASATKARGILLRMQQCGWGLCSLRIYREGNLLSR